MKPLEKSIHAQAAPAPKRRRKGPTEPRAMSRAHKVKDGRSVLLIFRPVPGSEKLTVHEGYFDTVSGAWWLANMAPSLPGCDPAEDLLGAPQAWLPMPKVSSITDEANFCDSSNVVDISDIMASQRGTHFKPRERKSVSK